MEAIAMDQQLFREALIKFFGGVVIVALAIVGLIFLGKKKKEEET